MREQFDELSGRIAAAYANVPVEQGTAEIDEAVSAVRHGR
jgi:hypothetical protein